MCTKFCYFNLKMSPPVPTLFGSLNGASCTYLMSYNLHERTRLRSHYCYSKCYVWKWSEKNYQRESANGPLQWRHNERDVGSTATQFLTWRDSCSVVVYAKFRSRMISANGIQVKQTLHRIWITMKYSLVKRSPGTLPLDVGRIWIPQGLLLLNIWLPCHVSPHKPKKYFVLSKVQLR